MRPSEKFNLHPSTHSVRDLKTTVFDVVCIGSGWAGRQLAAQVCKAGYSALVIEKELFGGDCPFWACVPSKILLRSDEALQAAKAVGGARERIISEKDVDVPGVFARRDAITANKDDSQILIPMTEATGATLVRGTGRLVGVKKVRITPFEGEAVDVEARLAVGICSGSEAVVPESVKEANPWTPRDATSADYVPERLIVMGGGAVGCEMATAYNGFGSKVTLVSSRGLLPSVDPEAGKLVQKSLEDRGVVVKTGTRVSKARRTDDGVVVQLASGETISGSELLVAAGRKGIMDFGLETLGIQSSGKHVAVDDSLCVKTSDGDGWLYAVGDINGRAAFTHAAKYHGRIAGNAIISKAQNKPLPPTALATADRTAIPQVVFTSPIVASVGLTRSSAAAKGIKVRKITALSKTLGGMLHSNTMPNGWAQWLVDEDERLVGATIVGADAADLIHASTVAIVAGMKLEQMVHCVPSFPTMSEVWLNLLEAAGY